MSPRRLPVTIAVLALACVLAGCTTADRVTENETWPLTWGDRELFIHEGQLAYATSGSAAAEAAEVVIGVAADFREITGAEPAHTVLIVLDDGDQLPVEDFAARIGEFARETKEIMGQTVEEDDEIPFESDDAPISADRMMTLIPILTHPGTLSPQPLAPTTIAGVAMLPTSDHRQEVIDDMIAAAMKKQKLSFWQRTLAAPIMPFIKRFTRTMLEKVSMVFLFEHHLSRYPDWSDEERAAFRDAFAERVGFDPDAAPDFAGMDLPEGARAGLLEPSPPPPETAP